MINEQLEYSEGFVIRTNYVCAGLEKDVEKRLFVHFLGGNIVARDPFTRYTNEAGELVVEVDTSALIAELDSHGSKYKGTSKELCAHYVLSLAAGEDLSKKDLLESARHYMKALGYGKGAKWFAVAHYDTDNVHVHIVACRAQLVHSDVSPDGRPRSPQFSIVKDSNSYQKGWGACREIEQKFGLQVVENPDQCFGMNGDLFKRGSDQSKILRGIIGDVWKEGKPKTFTDLVMRLNSKGVFIKGVTESASDGLIKGIMFKLDRADGRWISGSKLKATRLTFDKLIEKEGLNYSPARDNAILSLPVHAYTLVKNVTSHASVGMSSDVYSTLLRAYVKILNKSEVMSRYVKNKGRSYGIYSDPSGMYLGFNARLSLKFRKKSKAEVEGEIEAKRIADLVYAAMKMMKNALNDLFYNSIVQIELCEADDLTDTALRLNVPVTVDATSTFDQHTEMEDAVDEQIESQMSYLATVLAPGVEPHFER